MSNHHKAMNQRRWLGVRKRTLDRVGWKCAECQHYGNEVDHIVPIADGGAVWAEDNLQVLCRGCHIAKTAKQNQRTWTAEEQAWWSYVMEL